MFLNTCRVVPGLRQASVIGAGRSGGGRGRPWAARWWVLGPQGGGTPGAVGGVWVQTLGRTHLWAVVWVSSTPAAWEGGFPFLQPPGPCAGTPHPATSPRGAPPCPREALWQDCPWRGKSSPVPRVVHASPVAQSPQTWSCHRGEFLQKNVHEHGRDGGGQGWELPAGRDEPSSFPGTTSPMQIANLHLHGSAWYTCACMHMCAHAWQCVYPCGAVSDKAAAPDCCWTSKGGGCCIFMSQRRIPSQP